MSEKRVQEAIDSGEIVNTKSLLAYDEDLMCKRCNHQFPLAEGNWEGNHRKYEMVKAIGIKCPNCDLVNVSYYKTIALEKIEKQLDKLDNRSDKKYRKLLNKYQKLFVKTQMKYGEFNVFSEKEKN